MAQQDQTPRRTSAAPPDGANAWSRPAAADPVQQSDSNAAPTIALPKGGGAIRGIGEKFAANPVTGTGSMSVPLAASPGRAGFGPQLTLSYDSGAGNGPFGFGWSLGIPAITRKTDKRLPQYLDSEESDVFILSGAEDLVPVLRADGSRFMDDTIVPGYTIHRYRPRIEGLFARVERWTSKSGDVHWRSISRENVTTLYGKTTESRIADPGDPQRVFSWLICESYDDKGNGLVYRYVSEDDENIDRLQTNERNRERSANRYLKRIQYGNRVSRLIQPDLAAALWLFELVFDYDEDHYELIAPDAGLPGSEQHQFVQVAASPGLPWTVRPDPFSSYRAGFEVRTYRRCRRVLMFHRFPELGNEPCLVRSTEFDYADFDYSQPSTIEAELAHPGSTRFASFIRSVTQSGYVRDASKAVLNRNNVMYVTYLKKSLPPLEFEYSKANIQDDVRDLDAGSLENLPIGLDGAAYQWVDLDGEGVSGILTEQAGAWFYKPSLGEARFGPMQPVARKPSLTALGGGRQQLLDLAGDGQLDLVEFGGPTPGFFERTPDEDWEPFKPFVALPNIPWDEPNLRFVDLNGDGHADVLITEDQIFTWHPSLAEHGFGPAQRVNQPLDEEQGPRLVFADGTQSIYLADMCGDGLTALARIRNGEVCYWPNLGYGRFGAKVTMDNVPWFDHPDQFDQKRVRVADIDGSGTNDIIYLGRDGVRLYFNQSGNSLSAPRSLNQFPQVDNLSAVTTADLLGNGTACLVWSSPLAGNARRPLRYIDLMGGQRPHLLLKTINNLGAETHVQYAPSTRFYLADKAAGKPWITKLPFPVHVVERVETYDRISRNRFVTRYAYHHGYFDGVEREFRGFGLVDQWDTEEFGALSVDGLFPASTNIDAASHVPPVLTRTWFHTGIYLGRDHVSDYFAGLLDNNDSGEYYRAEPADADARKLLLDDTVLPAGLTIDEEREACRALKGSMLRQEVYGLDGSSKEPHPYTVTEQNFTVGVLQQRGDNRHAVFFTHAREVLSYHYERNPADPRIGHSLVLEVDNFGNVKKTVAVAYGRRPGQSPFTGDDQAKQERSLLTYTVSEFTNAVDDPDDYRAPLPYEVSIYELTGFSPSNAPRFSFTEFAENNFALLTNTVEIQYEQTSDPLLKQKRLIERIRTLYRNKDLTALLPPQEIDALALPGESYKLAFTPGLLSQVFRRDGQPLLPNPANVLGAQTADGGGYLRDPNDHWWIPSGRIFLSPNAADVPVQELNYAQQHFFLPRRHRDPFHTATISTESLVTHDAYDLLVLSTRDPLGNQVTAENDYRVLQVHRVTDPNLNGSEAAFDALGMVVGTAVIGKATENLGDSLVGFDEDLTEADILDHLANPLVAPQAILQRATTRLVYDVFAYFHTRSAADPKPAVVYALARETHDVDLASGENAKIQHGFSYSDGFGREIQKKVQAEPGPLVAGGPVVSPRWVGSGWTVFNNKGKPVRQYEPFFSATADFEFGVQVGVSPILFYDALDRVIATLHPNNTYGKVVLDRWQQTTWDVNDTVLGDPRSDVDIKGYVAEYFKTQPTTWQTWHQARITGSKGALEQTAAQKAAKHANTPATAYFDALGRPFLTRAHNGFDQFGNPIQFPTRVSLDIEGNQREVRDAIEQSGDAQGRVVMRYDYDMLGNRLHQTSMEAGERWTLNDVMGKPIRAWDSRNHSSRTEYDELRRPLRSFVIGADVQNLASEIQFDETIFGESTSSGLTVAQVLLANLRGKSYKHYDTAGVVTSDAYDFKGNLLRSTRQLVQDYKTTPDWSQNPKPALEAEIFASSTRYDALNRPIQMVAPCSNQANTRINVIRPGYNEANLLERVGVWLGQTAEPSALLDPLTADLHAVTNIDYDAKGQRTLITYGNGVETEYSYDRETFRLTGLTSTRPTTFPTLPANERVVQALSYTYDPAGNVTHIQDNADIQNVVFFQNQRVEPSADYTYDALYRLTEATGREHIGQLAQTTWDDKYRVNLPQPGDGNAMRNYTEQYLYDAVGNFESLTHQALKGTWTRDFAYNEASLIEAGKQSNRLSSATVGTTTEPYAYDTHGNMTSMPHLTLMQWGFKDQLSATSRQAVNAGTPDTTYYVYDAAGERVRKATERQAATGQTTTRMKERIYLGGFEIYREYANDGTEVTLERETLHIMDDKQRIALVETKTIDADVLANTLPETLTRYQFGNHLGSASLELDDLARVISYEEYTPYGSTSYQAVRSSTEAPKRYRYVGKERDGENGLSYHGARYYAAWLARWLNADPIGLEDGLNLFSYCLNNPIVLLDATGMQAGGPDDFPKNPKQGQIFEHNVAEGSWGFYRYDQKEKWVAISRPSLNLTAAEVTPTEAKGFFQSSLFKGIVAGLAVTALVVITGGLAIGALAVAATAAGITVSAGTVAAIGTGLAIAGDIGIGLTAASTFQSLRHKDLLNNPISKEEADFNIGMGVGGLLGGALAKPLSKAVGGLIKFIGKTPSITATISETAASTSSSSTSQFPALSPWPPNSGSIEGTVEREFLMPGKRLSRYGSEEGKFLSSEGTPFEARSLRPGTEFEPLYKYDVIKPHEVQSSGVAPHFLQGGLGTQYQEPVPVKVLLRRGVLKLVGAEWTFH